ncbi:MAG: hypothetical protein ACI9HY_001674 [Planctomycetaceae bacterium]|jgi:hypothetical protein
MMLRTGRLLFLVTALMCSTGALASLSVAVDRTEISDADLLKLTLLVRDSTTATNPDFRALEQDFEIVQRSGPNQSSKISIINGRQSSEVTVSWELRLRPKRLGTLTIPAFRMGSDVSRPINIQVRRQSEAMKQKMSQLVFFDTSVDTTETYVQGQIIYTIKLYYVENISGDFPPMPAVPDAVVETVEGERRYDAITNGRRYYVLEKRYGIYPQKSGLLTIPRQTFSGFRVGPGFFSTREPILSRSEAHPITVKAKPSEFTGDHWLPATNVTIEESWVGGTPEFIVGEPVNRSIVISASGVAASLLPPLNDTSIEGAKTYQDPAVEEQNLTAEGIDSTQTIVVGIVPTRAGSLNVPAIEIPWWNTKTDQLEVATIAAQSFEVKASPKNQQSTPVSQSVVAETPAAVSPRAAAGIENYWQYLAIGFFVLWLFTIVLWFFQSRKSSPAPVQVKATLESNFTETLKQLKSACRDSDAKLAQPLTVQWGNLKYSNIHSLQELTKVVGDVELQAAINELETCLYAPDAAGSWDGQTLWTAIKLVEQRKGQKRKSSRLKPTLNPSST